MLGLDLDMLSQLFPAWELVNPTIMLTNRTWSGGDRLLKLVNEAMAKPANSTRFYQSLAKGLDRYLN